MHVITRGWLVKKISPYDPFPSMFVCSRQYSLWQQQKVSSLYRFGECCAKFHFIIQVYQTFTLYLLQWYSFREKESPLKPDLNVCCCLFVCFVFVCVLFWFSDCNFHSEGKSPFMPGPVWFLYIFFPVPNWNFHLETKLFIHTRTSVNFSVLKLKFPFQSASLPELMWIFQF